MKLSSPLIASVLMLLAGLASPAFAAGERVALVIGNANYPGLEKPLPEPINDARDIADELKRDGFDVEIGENLVGDTMRRAFDRLYNRIKPGSVALVFYSGFGIQAVNRSYLIPLDAQIWTEADVRHDGVSLESVLSEMSNRGAGTKIALIDASRRNPFERQFRKFSAGLASIAASNTLVMYSAAPNSVVSDNGTARSLFVSELLKEIRVPDLMAEETLNRTRVGVIRASRSEQVPWISSSLTDDFSFIPGQKSASTPPIAKPVAIDPAPPRREAALPPAPEPARPAASAPETRPAIALPAPAPPASVETDPIKQRNDLADDPQIRPLTKRIADNPDDTSALYRRGQVYASKGAYTLAVRDFNETLRLNPRDVEAYNNRCWVRTVIGDLPAALKDCNEALRLRPNFVDALDSRGLVNLKNGMARNAIADFDAALQINPRLTSSLYGRGLAKQKSGDFAGGEIDIANAKTMDPNIVGEFDSYGVR